MIESQAHIDEIARYCQTVWVDKVGSEWIEPQMQANFETVNKRNLVDTEVARSRNASQTIGVYGQAKRITKSMLDTARLGNVVDTEQAKVTVSECVDSVLENSEAMLWMTRMREAHNYTVEHCLNVCVLTIAFGRQLGLNHRELNELGLCALLHDVGKMKTPVEVLDFPGALDGKSWEIMQAHTTEGRNLLMASPSLPGSVIDVAYSHHERIDGEGYPRGLKGVAIPYYARIVGIIDAYDAMTAERCYAPAISSTEAIKILIECKDNHFDRNLVDQFVKYIGLYPPGTIVELINGQVGIVVAANYKYQHLPKVLVVLDPNKEPCKERVRNLADIEKGRLGEEYFIRASHLDGTFGLHLNDYQDKGLRVA